MATTPSHSDDSIISQLGDDFKQSRPLWNSEVKIILSNHYAQIKEEDTKKQLLSGSTIAIDEYSDKRYRMINDTLSYVNAFSNYSSPASIESAYSIRTQRDAYKHIDEWEMAIINNNRIDDYDECISLIPTLKEKIHDRHLLTEGDLKDFLNELKRLQSV